MRMGGGIAAMDVIVLLVLLFTFIFLAAWISSAKLRTWIESPKYRFLADVEGYDRVQTGATSEEGEKPL